MYDYRPTPTLHEWLVSEAYRYLKDSDPQPAHVPAWAVAEAQLLIDREERRSRKPTKHDRKNFYASWGWRQLRYRILLERGRVCECCGAKAGDKDHQGQPVVISVDHIHPTSKRWDLRYEPTNLQVLCMSCQMGKSNISTTDFRMESNGST